MKVFVFILLFCGLALRLIPLFYGNAYFGFDQGLDSILTKLFVFDQRINLVSRYSGLQGVLMGPLWTWVLALPYLLGQGNPISAAIFMSVFSVVSSGITFLLVKKMTTARIALLAMGWTLFAPIFVFNSQVPASPHPLTFIFIFFIYFLWEILNGKKIFWVPLGILVGVFFQFEIGFALFSPLAIFLSLVFAKKPLAFFNKYFFIGAGLCLVTFLPQIIYDFRHQHLILNGLTSLFGQNSLYQTASPLYWRFFDRAWSFGDDFLTMTLIFRHPLPVLLVVLTAIYGWFKVASKYKNLLLVLMSTLLAYYVGFSLYPGPIWNWYRAGLPIVYVLLLAIPFGALVSNIFLVFFVWLIFNSMNLLGWTTQRDDVTTLKTQTQILDYIYQSANGKPFAYFAYVPALYDYIWQYDFWWYGQKKYGYLPNNWQMGVPLLGIGEQNKPPTGKEQVLFLIIEPNRDRPWEGEGWKKSFIKIGETIETKSFPGDVIVEKRIND